jgi:hypothetical protein
MKLKELDTVKYHPTSEKMMNVLTTKTQNHESDLYFRVLIANFMAQMSSSMRVEMITPHRGVLPLNVFVCALAESGAGKGHSLNICEGIIKGFKDTFMKHTAPEIAEQNLLADAQTKAIIRATDEVTELEKIQKEYDSLGIMPFSFDSGTGPAYKQVRTKMQMAGIGSLNMVCDEIGTNLLNNAELFAVNLEAYDIGLIKQKIIKNTADNKRSEERDDPVPSNMLIFGTPSKLFNGGKEEVEFYSLLETGYARRLFFGLGRKTAVGSLTAKEMFDALTSTSVDTVVDDLSNHFVNLADPINYNAKILMDEPVALINIQYQLDCEALASELSVYESVKKAEIQHRYFKAMKLAGIYAFMDSSNTVTEDHMYAAIKLTEDSGKAFVDILSRDKNYVRLAKYIAEVKQEVTYADLTEDLQFFTGSISMKNDLLQLATAWGIKNNIIIKKTFADGIDFFTGETLQETDLSGIMVSYSKHEAYDYVSAKLDFKNLHKLTQVQGYHWCNHSFLDNHRLEDKAIPEFNSVVIDVDGGVSMTTAKDLLKDYNAFYYTTKRSTDTDNRFRIVLPIKYHLKLTKEDHKEFMSNIFSWLPFEVDTGTGQRCKKWLTNTGTYVLNEGESLDPMQFIPKTAKNEERKKANKNLSSMDNTERWFAKEVSQEGNRNNIMCKYALMLLDSGMDVTEVEERTKHFNNKIPNPLKKSELEQTVFKTLYARAKHDKDNE